MLVPCSANMCNIKYCGGGGLNLFNIATAVFLLRIKKILFLVL